VSLAIYGGLVVLLGPGLITFGVCVLARA